MLYIPISFLFFLIGTSAFAYYQTHPEALNEVRRHVAEAQLTVEKGDATEAAIAQRASKLTDKEIGDKVLPHFIVHGLPRGATGLLIAAIFAAAMSSIDTSLNSSATIVLKDIYSRFFRPSVGERESMVVLYLTTILVGALGTGAAIAMIGIESILDVWWILSGIFAGGMLGLFLLGMVSRLASRRAAAVAVVVGIVVIFWMSLPKLVEMISKMVSDDSTQRMQLPGWFESPLHENMIIVVGTLTILSVGLLLTKLFPAGSRGADSPDTSS